MNQALARAGKRDGDANLALGPGPGAASAAVRRGVRQAGGDHQRRRSGARRRRAARLEAHRRARRDRLSRHRLRRQGPLRRRSAEDITIWSASTSRRRTRRRTKGKADAKVKALEEIDRHIVGPLLEALPKHGDWRILVSPDHRTPLRTRAHAYGMVPFAVAGTGITQQGAGVLR